MAHYDGKYYNAKPRKLARGPRKPWRAYLFYDGKHHYLGHYHTEHEARTVENDERKRLQAQREEDEQRAAHPDS